MRPQQCTYCLAGQNSKSMCLSCYRSLFFVQANNPCMLCDCFMDAFWTHSSACFVSSKLLLFMCGWWIQPALANVLVSLKVSLQPCIVNLTWFITSICAVTEIVIYRKKWNSEWAIKTGEIFWRIIKWQPCKNCKT